MKDGNIDSVSRAIAPFREVQLRLREMGKRIALKPLIRWRSFSSSAGITDLG
jgi:hypothetical protein